MSKNFVKTPKCRKELKNDALVAPINVRVLQAERRIADFRPVRFSTLTVYLCLHASFISIFLQICQVVVKKVSYRVQSSFRISNNENETATTVMPSFNAVNLKCFPSR